MESNKRKPHAVLNIPTRLLKGKKIEALLDLPETGGKFRLLEIGTGSGGIASYFANYSANAFEVDAVDIVDSRLVVEGYRFHLIQGTNLPFPDETFDIVITNHVIEHVGDYDAQMRHLFEVKRVLKSSGEGYLAVPNRWMMKEPHYNLLFLSWLPKCLRSGYLKLMRGQAFYDCEPLEKYQLEKMFDKCELVYNNKCIAAMKLMQSLENSKSFLLKIVNSLPASVLELMVGVIPTLIYTFKKR